MTEASNKAPLQNHATYTATLPSDLNQTLRNSLTKALESYYAPVQQIPSELSEMISRLERAEKK